MIQQFPYIQKRENANLKRYMPPIFIATLFTIAKTWKQPKFPSKNEWIKKMWHTHTHTHRHTHTGILLGHKKE